MWDNLFKEWHLSIEEYLRTNFKNHLRIGFSNQFPKIFHVNPGICLGYPSCTKLRSSIPEAQEAVEARGRSSEMFGAFFALAGSMYIYVHLCTSMYYSEDLLSEDECPHWTSISDVTNWKSIKSHFSDTGCFTIQLDRHFFSCSWRHWTVAAFQRRCPTSRSNTPARTRGKEGVDVSGVGVMFIFGWGLVWRCSWISETKDIVVVQSGRGFFCPN